MAATASPGNQVQTLLTGKKVTLTGNATAGLEINGTSNIIFTDIAASNGVIHLINQVLTAP